MECTCGKKGAEPELVLYKSKATLQFMDRSGVFVKMKIITEWGDELEDNTKENQKRMNDATSCMEQIHKSTDECKRIITTLGEESKEIIGIIRNYRDIKPDQYTCVKCKH